MSEPIRKLSIQLLDRLLADLDEDAAMTALQLLRPELQELLALRLEVAKWREIAAELRSTD